MKLLYTFGRRGGRFQRFSSAQCRLHPSILRLFLFSCTENMEIGEDGGEVGAKDVRRRPRWIRRVEHEQVDIFKARALNSKDKFGRSGGG